MILAFLIIQMADDGEKGQLTEPRHLKADLALDEGHRSSKEPSYSLLLNLQRSTGPESSAGSVEVRKEKFGIRIDGNKSGSITCLEERSTELLHT